MKEFMIVTKVLGLILAFGIVLRIIIPVTV